jgi:hypothetical protein
MKRKTVLAQAAGLALASPRRSTTTKERPMSQQDFQELALHNSNMAMHAQKEAAKYVGIAQQLANLNEQLKAAVTKAEQDKQAALDEAGALRAAVAELEAEVATLRARLMPPPAPDVSQPAEALIVGTEETVD